MNCAEHLQMCSCLFILTWLQDILKELNNKTKKSSRIDKNIKCEFSDSVVCLEMKKSVGRARIKGKMNWFHVYISNVSICFTHQSIFQACLLEIKVQICWSFCYAAFRELNRLILVCVQSSLLSVSLKSTYYFCFFWLSKLSWMQQARHRITGNW